MDYLLILSAPLLGILVGLLPSMGMTLAIVLLYPVLENFTPEILIIFYSIATNARDFSGSVSALNFGLLGEVTSAPAIIEKKFINTPGDQRLALRNTAMGSIVGVITGIVFMIIFIKSASGSTFILRSDFLGTFLLLTFCFLVFWTQNNRLTNFVLIVVGLLVGRIGEVHYSNIAWFTFDNQYLYGGIPVLPFLLGIYGIPKTISLLKISIDRTSIVSKKSFGGFDLISSLRGSIIGSFCGIIPFIGNSISSNVAHNVEAKIKKNHNVKDAMARLTSAESSNNASQITVLIPLLLLGVAIQPSELVLLDIIDTMGWEGRANATLISQVIICLIASSFVTAFFCYNVVNQLILFFRKHLKIIVYFLIIFLFLNIVYMGYQADQAIYYIVVLVVSSLFGFWFVSKNIDAVPVLLTFLLEDKLFEVSQRLIQLWF